MEMSSRLRANAISARRRGIVGAMASVWWSKRAALRSRLRRRIVVDEHCCILKWLGRIGLLGDGWHVTAAGELDSAGAGGGISCLR